MAEIDGSIPASAGKNVPNLMANVGQIAQTMNAVNQNRLFQAKAVAGQLLQRSIDPSTGQPDLQTFNKLLSMDPRTAPYASEALTTSIAQQTAGRSLQAAQGDAVRQAIGSLGPNANHDSVLNALGILSATKQVTPDFAATIAGNIPGDPAQINAWARNNFQLPALGAQAAMEAQQPKPTAINVGDRIDLVTTPNAGMGAPSEAGHLDVRLSPGESVSPAYQRFNSTTQQPEIVTKGAAVGAGAGQPGAAAIPAGPPIGAEAAASAAGTGSANLLTADRADQANSAQRLTVLRKIDQLLGTPQGTTGPGTQVMNGYRNFLLANAPFLASITNGGVNEAKIRSATQDELKKYMTQVAGAAAAQYGQGTNEKLAVAASGNANPDLSTLANRDVTRMNIALERAKQARMAAFDASNQQPQAYGQFATTWNRTVDPRAFMLDFLTKEERAKVLSTIKTDAEKRAFLKGKQAAEAAGLYSEADIPR